MNRTVSSSRLWQYTGPLWRFFPALLGLTLASNALVVLQPVCLAAILSGLLGTAHTPPPAGASLFNLNHIGARLIHGIEVLLGNVPPDLLLVLGMLYITLSILASAFDYGAYVLALKVRVETARRIQFDLLEHLFSLDLRFFHRQKSGELMSRVTQDAVNTGQGLGVLVKAFIHHGLQLIVYGAYLVSTSVWLTLCASGVIALHFLLTQLMKRPIRVRSRRIFDVQADFSTTLQEALLGVRVAKSFGAESFELAKLQRAIDGVADAGLRHGRIDKLEAPVRTVLDSLGIIGIFLVAAAQLRAGQLTVQGLLLYVYVGRLIIAPANHMASNYLWLQSLLASFERISTLFAERPRVVDGRLSPTRFERTIEVRRVSFAYGEVRALDDVSLEIRRGEIVALVGPSGAGKSTLTDLILRLYDPDAGEILMDGVNLRALRQADYRRLFGVVSQECLLFHDTVRSNIRYGRDDVTEDAIREAARIANAHDFIERLPHGYDTLVGDRGVRLSGGERQRIAIARAIVHRPEILILDEATSSLDSDSERQVQMAIDRATRHATCLVIAHRLSTVLHASKIVVMERSRIVDIGRHDELLARCGLYRHLCELQLTAMPDRGGRIADGDARRNPTPAVHR